MERRKVAFVTGASRGIGRACAISLAQAGYDVAVSARTMVDGTAFLDDAITPVPGGLDSTVEKINETGQEGFPIHIQTRTICPARDAHACALFMLCQ